MSFRIDDVPRLRITIEGTVGSGKTTLARVLANLLEDAKADVVLMENGLELAPSPELRALPWDVPAEVTIVTKCDVVPERKEGR